MLTHDKNSMNHKLVVYARLISEFIGLLSIRRWDADTGEAVGTPLRGQSAQVTSVAKSSDGEFIFSGSWDCTVERWRAYTGEAISDPLRGHNSRIEDVAISEDNKYIV